MYGRASQVSVRWLKDQGRQDVTMLGEGVRLARPEDVVKEEAF